MRSNDDFALDPGNLITRLERPKLGQEVTRQLRDALLSGKLTPGQRMQVDELAASFGTSAMPVREALMTLASEGLVTEVPRRGFRANELNRQDLKGIFQVHAFVAGLLARDAALGMTPSLLRQLHELQLRAEQAIASAQPDTAVHVEELNYRFHSMINRVSNSDRLRWFLRVTSRYVPRNFYQDIPGWMLDSVQDHPIIMEALTLHDPDLAESRMAAHITHAGQLMTQHLESLNYWSLSSNSD